MTQLHSILDKLVQVHKKTLELSYAKTNVIKDGNTDELSKLLMKERKYLQEVEQLEEKRESIANVLFEKHGLHSETKSMSQLLEFQDNDLEKERLEATVVSLVEVIIKIKQNEQLNSSLIQQSMQFVQLSLEMLQPSVQNINYDGKSQGKNASKKQSVFDSKA